MTLDFDFDKAARDTRTRAHTNWRAFAHVSYKHTHTQKKTYGNADAHRESCSRMWRTSCVGNRSTGTPGHFIDRLVDAPTPHEMLHGILLIGRMWGFRSSHTKSCVANKQIYIIYVHFTSSSRVVWTLRPNKPCLGKREG